DKVMAKVAFRAAGLPVAPEVVFRRGSAPASEQAREAFDRLGAALVVKPATQGSALGVTLLPNLTSASDTSLSEAFETAFALDEMILVERFVRGLEVTCGVLEDDEGPRALPPTEIRSHAAIWYDFQSRYGTGGSSHVCPAGIGDERIARVQSIALAA